jgi:hypothetical protein
VRTARTALALRWLPALAGAAYLATVAVLWHEVITNNNWDTDVSGALTLAERLRGDGPVVIAHYGMWTTFWWMLATRALPWHEHVWSVSGYVLTLLSVAVLGWATARVAGRWAGLTAAATALVVGPFALRSFISLDGAHLTNVFGAVVLAAALVALVRTGSWLPVFAAGLIAGTNAASDPLLWIAGIVPFALAAGILVLTTRRKDFGLRAGATLVVTVVSALATSVIMRALDFHVFGSGATFDRLQDVPANTVQLGRMLAFLGGANYAIAGPYPREPLRAIVALLTLAAVFASLVAALKRRRAEPALRAYAFYWAAVTVVLGLAFVVTPNATDLGPKSVNYLLTLAPAAAAGAALLAARSLRAQLAVGLAVATVAAVNIDSIANGRAEVTGVAQIQQYARPITRFLEQRGVTRGFAYFWEAQNLSWQTDMRLVVAPVRNCGRELCPYNIFTITSWYEPRGGPTFLLIDPAFIQAPPFVSEAAETRRYGPLKLYVFEADVAKHIHVVAPS